MRATVAFKAKDTWDAQDVAAHFRSMGLKYQYGSHAEVLVLAEGEAVNGLFHWVRNLSVTFSGVLKSIEIRTSDGELWSWVPSPKVTQQERDWLRGFANTTLAGQAQGIILRLLDEADVAATH